MTLALLSTWGGVALGALASLVCLVVAVRGIWRMRRGRGAAPVDAADGGGEGANKC